MAEKPEPEITDEWPTKTEVANRLGKSLAGVTRLQKAGKLHPHKDEDGCNRYEPAEVQRLLDDPSEVSADRREEFAEYELSTVRALIGLVREPREKIDDLLFKIIERQEIQIGKLLAQIEANRVEVEAARDGAADRTVASNMIQSETRVKELAGTRFIEMLSRLMTNGKQSGVQLTPEQLEQLLIASAEGEPFLTSEQTKAAQATIVAWKAKEKQTAIQKTPPKPEPTQKVEPPSEPEPQAPPPESPAP